MSDEQDDIILSYRLPWWGRIPLFPLPLLIFVAILVISIVVVMMWPAVLYVGVLLSLDLALVAVTYWLITQVGRLIVAIECTYQFITMHTLMGAEIIVPWAGIWTFKRLAGGFLFMDTNGPWFLIVRMPRKFVNDLLAIMKEKGKVRIAGFD